MEALLKSDTAMNILATISLAQFLVIVVLLVGIAIVCYKFKDAIKEFLEDYRQKTNRKEEIEKKINHFDEEIKELKEYHDEDMQQLKEYHDKDMEVFYQKQLSYRQQSLDKQAMFDKHFSEIDAKIDSLIELLGQHKKQIEEQYEETREIKKNELREKLLNMYRFYTSIEQNPTQEWNEMEAEVFWDLFRDYEKLGGNGFMHNTVKPAMKALKVVTI